MKSKNSTTLKNISLLVLLQFVVAGCAMVAQRTQSVSSANEVIADDLVSVFTQLETLNPASSVVWMSEEFASEEPFSAALSGALYDAGYAVRVGGQKGFAESVEYSVASQPDQTDGAQTTYTVTIGGVSVRRSYAETEIGSSAPYGLLPAGGMQVRGADASTLVVDDNRFYGESQYATSVKSTTEREAAETPAPGVVAPEPVLPVVPVVPEPQNQITETTDIVASSEQAVPVQVPEQNRALLEVVAPSVAQMSAGADSTGIDSIIGRLNEAPTMNFKELGRSNFADVLDELGIVRETILTFENDSIFLGETNKAKVRQIVSMFDPDSDIFSVIGCSHGKTNLTIGVEGLALGRASRVVEELVYEGVPETKILDEGCWAGEAYDERMPRRGVVLTLKRVVTS